MTRTTSAKAYREETENGNITKKQYEVWAWLKLNGPATGRQVSAAIPGGHKRLAELKDCGRAKEIGRVTDSISGKTAIVWDYSIPHPLDWRIEKGPNKPTRKALEEKISHLEERCIELEKIVAGYPTLMGLIYDKGYQQGREDESRGISVDI